MTSHEPRLQIPDQPVPSTGIKKVIKKFNRNTTWVAAGLLGSVIFAALMVALQERHAQADGLRQESGQKTNDLLSKPNPVAISDAAGLNERSTGEITSSQATSVDRNLTPETNPPEMQPNAISWSPTQRSGSARVLTKNPHVRLRSSLHPRYVDVKTRLIALWHQSLRREKSPGWILFSKSNGWQRKNVSDTVTTSH
ncbi:MAG: hypothetical protein JO334_09800 [Verrucomicrobia bacterium]|nr:hypothetical protein [Verrucomicrobiota bacterium]